MAHKSQLENKKYRNWAKAGLGLKYVKDGLEPFCEHLVNQQHTDILNKVKRKHNLSAVSCGLCDTHTLQPDHVRTRSRECPLGQIHCNCQYPGKIVSCPNNVCGAIYDEIIQLHASSPPAPYWRNTDAHQWFTEPWSVAKCFINASGYEQKTRAVEFDCPGLLHMLMNNIEFHQHIKCGITGTDVFSRVLKARNEIFHSHTMELEDTEANSYIEDMIELLEDETEIKHRQESKDAIKNLRELKKEDFIISTTDEAEIRRVAMAAIREKEAELKQTIIDAGNELKTNTTEGKHELEGKTLDIKSELEQTGQKIRKEFATTAAEGKHDLEGKGLIIQSDLEQTGQKIRKELVTTAAEGKHDLEGKGLIIQSELEQIRTKIRKELVMKDDEIRATAAESKRDLEGKGLVIKAELEQTVKKLEQNRIELEKQLTVKEKEIGGKLEQKLQESKLHSETIKTLIEDSIKDNAETKQQAEINKKKAEFQEKLVKRYEKYVRKVPCLPLQPKRNQRNINDVYVPSWITVERKDEESVEWKEVKIFLHEIFRNDDNPAKYIYVLGEAGSGKSMFCKILVHFWCIAHSCPECSIDKSDIVKEMGSFKYLFYVSLRHSSDCDSIEKMLVKLYRDPALGDILQNESGKCLIVLDGLDEWTPEKKHNSQFLTPGLPGRDLDADYTIITTSRQWKFDALPITDSEVDKKIKLRGIDQIEMYYLTKKTVEMLNDIFRKSKNAKNCIINLQSRPVSDIIHIPLILQQLIFLWFDDKLQENSKYTIYSSMLSLFLEWKAVKSSENQECDMITQECLIYPPLPDYLCQFDTFRENTRPIQYLSHLAYETLFDKNKETTLTFSRSTLKRLNMPNDVITFCLNVGILTEEENVSLYASMSQQSSFSFFHKSIQEYLAAVYVASQFREMVNSLKLLQKDKYEHTDVCKKCVLKYFGSCETVVDILEQSNVFIILCGLEPRLLTNVSEYIYSVAVVDRMVVEERNKLQSELSWGHNELTKDVQACIFACIDEVISSGKNVHTPVYIADLYVLPFTKLVPYGKNIVLENVLSVDVNGKLSDMEESDKEALHVFLSKCDQLKVMKVEFSYPPYNDERTINAVAKILATNVSTLETIRLTEIDKKIIPLLVSIIPKMRRLVSLQMSSSAKVSHKFCLSVSKVLKQTKSLRHISLDISCENRDQHMIDLSKHKQLQHVDIGFNSFRLVNCNTDNLETCKLYVSSSAIINQLCNSLYKACKLKHLDLHGFLSMMHFRIGAIAEGKTVTENLIRLLPSLVSLSTLNLLSFTFTDNIITCPSDMKNLKEIVLHEVKMSMTTWCKFIDSLPALPQSVQVNIYNMHITDETITSYIYRDAKKVAEALQYVREKTNLFRVTRDDYFEFRFSTKKV